MKVWTYVFIAVGMMLLLQMAGFSTGIDGVLNIVGLGTNHAEINNSTLFDILFSGSNAILILAVATGISISFFTKSSSENYVLLPLILTVLVAFASTFISIMNYSFSHHPIWISSIILLLFGPVSIGYLIGLAEFFRGTD